jgi:predicted TPR repeat methyltransferase
MLEYGAGTGLVTQALSDSVGSVVLVDSSRGMREVMRAKVDAGRLPRAQVWDLDLTNDPVPHERFGLIVTVLALHHIATLDPVLAGFAQLLEPGGHLCIVDLEEEDGSFHGDDFDGHHGFQRSALADALTAQSFTDVTFTSCHHVVRHGATYPLFLATCVQETRP